MLLPCASTGNPEPSIAWSRDNGELPVNRTVGTPIGIAIDAVQVNDTGKYTCTATNILGSTTKTFYLAVQSTHSFVYLILAFIKNKISITFTNYVIPSDLVVMDSTKDVSRTTRY